MKINAATGCFLHFSALQYNFTSGNNDAVLLLYQLLHQFLNFARELL